MNTPRTEAAFNLALGLTLPKALAGMATFADKLECELHTASEKIQKADDRINAYHIECSKQYGPMPTEYQKGVLQGIECGRSLARFNRESTK